MLRVRFVFIVFLISTVLIAAVHLRAMSNRVYFRYRASVVARQNIKQQLWNKQILLDSYVNPVSVMDRTAAAGRP